jgi:hypothetical protein
MQGKATIFERQNFGDYIVYVDESGDHSVINADSPYPIFVLAFCIFDKSVYVDLACPSLQRFKFKYFGHDIAVLHERDIVKRLPPFEFLFDPATRESFLHGLTDLVDRTPFTLIAIAVRKSCDVATAENIYHMAMRCGIGHVRRFLQDHRQTDRTTHVVFERRGPTEDRALTHEFYEIAGAANGAGVVRMEPILSYKAHNAGGLQFADLAARPIGRHVLDPRQPNRAVSVLKTKLWRGPDGTYEGWGLTVLP